MKRYLAGGEGEWRETEVETGVGDSSETGSLTEEGKQNFKHKVSLRRLRLLLPTNMLCLVYSCKLSSMFFLYDGLVFS